jgi:hypothetical protein
MTEQEAMTIADDFVAARLGPEPKTADGSYTLKAIGVRFSIVMKRWTIVYQITVPHGVYDGDIIVVIDPETREAAFFNDIWG